MIQGRFGDNGEIYFDIELITGDGLSLTVEAMLDTGFTELCVMNDQDIRDLGWRFLNQDKLITAKGEALFDIYLGKVAIDRQEYEIPVFAGDEIQEILLGSRWLKQFVLFADYLREEVTLS
ncbi:aspartyl protease [Pannus brasiliensis CCIBt3594]|uniref:Aspartyl protease n=1 Tax=Pannus brasiliensis CCIBt3594 TaxID=1427578 RepID=A0AAW9QW75_9CHRO